MSFGRDIAIGIARKMLFGLLVLVAIASLIGFAIGRVLP
jgi:hypothetical protein